MINKESLQFIDDLKNNNNRDWFLENKKRYESFKADYQNLVSLVLKSMKPLDEKLETLEVKNCTFRINRDIRFSKNKMPYKTNFGLWLSLDKSRKNAPGYYIHYEKGQSFIAGGLYGPEPEDLKKIRKEIAFFHEDLEAILNDKNFKKEFGYLNQDEDRMLKRAPKDYDENHPAINLLKFKSFIGFQKIDDSIFLDKNFTTIISQKLSVLKPLTRFLDRALETIE